MRQRGPVGCVCAVIECCQLMTSPFSSALLWIGVAVCALLLVSGLVLLWLLFGRGPRRARSYRRAMKLLRQSRWKDALIIVRECQQGGKLSKFWEGRLRNAEGESHRTAGVEAIQAGELD